MKLPSSYGRYFHTLRHVPVAQIGSLLGHRIKGFYRRRFPSRTAHTIQRKVEREYPLTSIRSAETTHPYSACGSLETSAAKEAYDRYRNGVLRILNRDHPFDRNDFWRLADSDSLSPLDMETLHYHGFLVDFSRLIDTPEVLESIERILTEWGTRFPPGTGHAWDPFTVAYRSRNWLRIHSCSTSCGKRSDRLRENLERSLFQHGLYLERNLERHLGGNHLLKDLCALAMLSGFFEGPTSDRWFRIVSGELTRQIEIQILPDGGHYERSPMYHVLVLADLVDAADYLERRDEGWVRTYLSPLLDRMARFLEGVLHGDGEVPLFNDSVLGQAPAPRSVLRRHRGSDFELSGEDAFETFPDSGFSRLRRNGVTVLFDHGRLGPDELMGHVHNDALSIEVSVDETRFIANRGVYEYTTGTKRDECRSIRSHTTPCVEGLEQSEPWGSFRVARRWHVDTSTAEKGEDGVWRVEGSWTRGGMPRIRRILRSSPDGLFRIEDRIEGSGRHAIEIPIHFASDVTVEVREEGKGRAWTWEAGSGDKRLYGTIRSSSPGEMKLEKSTWWPRFHVETPSVRLRLSIEGDCPVRVDTLLATDPGAIEAHEASSGG